MKKGFMRFVAVFLVLLTVTMYVPMNEDSIFSLEASAATKEGSLGGNVRWKYDTKNTTLTISGSGATKDYSSTPSDFTSNHYLDLVFQKIKNRATKIVVNNGVTAIGNYVFNGFEKVTSVSLPASLTKIGKDAFSGIKNLTSVALPEKLATISTNAFNNTGITKVEIPYSVTTYGANAFPSGCKVVCNYGDAAYNKVNKANVELRQPVLITKLSALSSTQVKLSIVLQNASGLNAANFTVAYNNGIAPASTDPVYSESNGVATATVCDTANKKVNVAFLSTTFIPYSDCSGKCEFTVSELVFNFAEGTHAAQTDVSVTTMMVLDKKVSVASSNAKFDEHFFVANGDKVLADCTNKGYTPEICSVCKLTREVDYVNELGHDYKSVVTPATCKDKGFTTHTCTRCNDTKVDTYTEVSGKHSYTDVVTPPTCTEKGYTTHTCSVCSDVTVDSYTDVAAHDYDAKVTPATCTAKGFTTYICKVCKHTYTGDETDIASHDYASVATDATCTESGYTTFKCKNCEESYKGDFVAELGHEYGEDGKCVRCAEPAPVNAKLEFNDPAVFVINEDAKVVIIKKTLTAAELEAAMVNEGWQLVSAEGVELEDSKLAATKCLVKSTITGETYTVIILGDVNCDGKITAADARIILRVSAKLESADEIVLLAANCDGKGNVTAADARIALRVSAKLQTL